MSDNEERQFTRLQAITEVLSGGRTAEAAELAGNMAYEIFMGCFDKLNPAAATRFPAAATLVRDRLRWGQDFYGRTRAPGLRKTDR